MVTAVEPPARNRKTTSKQSQIAGRRPHDALGGMKAEVVRARLQPLALRPPDPMSTTTGAFVP